ncbi:cytidine deaminase [Microlunatus panaciterrae]|uniref:Cytidine deaminase n=1 Tax=Microlunatus panaciterrae TaxID=400768 RepID=A0ABS2RFK8_9ACTN|nr:cytidine deaminase [Microlunatus panaciterrae]MBM7797781.1 hypothetical protein [Microlunatus panaciterrae]
MTQPDDGRPADAIGPSDPEDLKIITLAKAARARTQARQGAAVRDTDGRTYAAVDVELGPVALSAITVATAMAVSSGAQGLEAVALAAESRPTEEDLAVVRALPGTGVVVWFANPKGEVQGMVEVDDR